MNFKIKYDRVLLKLSGEVLQGVSNFGIDMNILNRISNEIKKIINLGVQIGIVVGGGNLFRGVELVKLGMNRVIGDQIGMFATIMNSLAIQDALHRIFINSYIISAIPLNNICKNLNYFEINNLLCKKYVLIFASGTGSPFFTTDSAACLRGIEIKADIVLKGTKVDGVFSADPLKHLNAKFYNKISYKYAIDKNLKIMDSTAFALAKDYNLPICVFNINKPGNLYRIILGKKEGTLII